MDDVNLKELFKEKARRYILGVINVVVGRLDGAGEENGSLPFTQIRGSQKQARV